MSANPFAEQIKIVRDRADILYERSREPIYHEPALLEESLEELRTALEELHVAEEELRQQNEELLLTRMAVEKERQRYHELFELAPDGYIVSDRYGVIVEANRAAATLLNVPQKFLVGKVLINFVPACGRRAFRAKMSLLQHTERVQEWEIRLKGRDESDLEAALTVTTVRDWEGTPVFFRWLMRDITARKQAEEQLRSYQLQNLQLVEESRLKTQFLAMMSHELRTPMNAIMGFAQVLDRQIRQQIQPDQAAMIDRILSNSKNLLRLINCILDFSKLKAGNLELKLEVFDLAELVRETVEELRCLSDQKHLAMSLHVAMENAQVVNDSHRLKQVLINLIGNAIKFTETGSVSVEVSEVTRDKIAIAIADTGMGIAQADLSCIFQEFRQLNQTSTRQQGGTGLGLAITDSLVRLMNGTINVKSQIGLGSTFRIELPRRVKEEAHLL